jgi:hypothetical protein
MLEREERTPAQNNNEAKHEQINFNKSYPSTSHKQPTPSMQGLKGKLYLYA